MTKRRAFRSVTVAIVACIGTAATIASTATAAEEPTKFVFSRNIGQEVNKTTKANVCNAIEIKNLGVECQQAVESGEPGGFNFPVGVAIGPAPDEDIYVADTNNDRVQELKPNGEFVLMFGKEVNENKTNICLAGEKCQAGAGGSGAGEFGEPESIAVDKAGNVYVLDQTNWRVEEFTASGEFVLMVGKEVNKTTKGNLCTEQEIKSVAVECQAGKQSATASKEHGAYKFTHKANILAIGGPEGLLYIGDEGRIEEIKADGAWAGEMQLPSGNIVAGLAVDETGKAYTVYEGAESTVHQLASNGVQISSFGLLSRVKGTNLFEFGIAIDPSGRLGVLQYEGGYGAYVRLYKTTELGAPVTEITSPFGPMFLPRGIAFSSADGVYAIDSGATPEVVAFEPVIFPNARNCTAKQITATTALLCGEINPKGVPTVGFFNYGPGGTITKKSPIVFGPSSGLVYEPVTFEIEELVPNEVYVYQVVAEAEVEGRMQQAAAEPLAELHTKTPPPLVPGAPEASFVGDQSAVLNAVVNPEHAVARYHFEYAACAEEGQAFAECGEVSSTPDVESSVYAEIPSSQEITGLTPGTHYAVRLAADNGFEYKGEPEGGSTNSETVGYFTTSPQPHPVALNGGVKSITAMGAVISGSVNPDGKPATYVFELGLDKGGDTEYSTVSSGSAGAGIGAVEETFALAGLLPATAYSFRITVNSGYGVSHSGAATFTTLPVPPLLEAPRTPAMLPLPAGIEFPKAGAKPKACQRHFRRDKHGRCIRVRKARKAAHKHKAKGAKSGQAVAHEKGRRSGAHKV